MFPLPTSTASFQDSAQILGDTQNHSGDAVGREGLRSYDRSSKKDVAFFHELGHKF